MTTCKNMAPAGELPASTEEGSEVTRAYQSGTNTAATAASVATSIREEDEDEAIDFSKQKKRKGGKRREKSVVVVVDAGCGGSDGDSTVNPTGEDAVAERAETTIAADAEAAEAMPPSAATDASFGYSYAYLLGRLRANLANDCPAHPSLQEGHHTRGSGVPPPRLAKIGGRRVAICNFGTICDALHRSRAHAQRFLLAELQTSGSLDKEEEALTLLARLSTAAVEQLLRKYIREYATCSQCKSHETTLLKAEKKGGGEWIRCGCCGAEAAVEPIKVGFTAVRRGERRANRE